MNWRFLLALYLLGLLVLFSVGQALCQTPVQVRSHSTDDVANYQTIIRQNTRFLGWKFAHQANQDTRKWVRTNRTQALSSVTNNIRQSSHSSTSPSSGTAAGFLWLSSLPTGFIPTAVTSGDFNEDGKVDFAVCNGGDNTVYVFTGNGDGTFQVPLILYTWGRAPTWITSVRLHKNGHVDLAVTNGDSNTLDIFPGNGDGTFQASTQISLSQIPTFILATDANNDGNQDLVVGLTIALDYSQPQFEILLGDGAGGFSGTLYSPSMYGDPNGPLPTTWIAAGDMNNDGYVDFLLTAGGLAFPYLSRSATGFVLGTPFVPPNAPDDLALVVELGDMDEDGCLDALETDLYAMANIAKGTCDGNFPTTSPSTPLGDFITALKGVDIDGDGHLDMVGSAVWYPLAGGGGYGTTAGYLVSVLNGDGKGDLGQGTVYRGGASAYSLVVDDFTGDGKPDILTANSLENTVSLFVNDGTGKFGAPQGETIGYVGGGPANAPVPLGSIEAADINGDGKPDLLLVEFGLGNTDPALLTVMLNDGAGKFLPAVRSPITVGDYMPIPRFVAGAFHSPTALDVIYTDSNTGPIETFYLAYFRGNGDGTFAAPVTLANPPNPQQVVAGDFNKDGKLDFAVVGTDITNTQWEFDVFLGDGTGGFTQLPAQIVPMLGSQPVNQLFAVDLNHDGKLDLLFGLDANVGWVTAGDDLIEAIGNGDGTFQTPKTLVAHFGAAALADLNGDGYVDLIQNRDPATFGTNLQYPAGVTIYRGAADGSFRQQPSYDLQGVEQTSLNPVIVGDFNGDGIPDIAVRHWTDQPVLLDEPVLTILQGVGDGTFTVMGHNYQLPAASTPEIGADFNGDGKTDLMELTGFTSSFNTILGSSGPTLNIALDSSPILGTSGQATVTLDVPASIAEDVVLSASDPAVQQPASLHFNAGEQSHNFSFTLGSGFDATHVLALSATLGTQTATTFGTVPNPNLTVGVSSSLYYQPTFGSSTNVNIEPGETFQMYANLSSEGGYSGTYSSFYCSGLPAGTSCSFNTSSVQLLPGGAGQVVATFTSSGTTPFGMSTVTIGGSDGFVPISNSFELGIGDFSLGIDPSTFVVGINGTISGALTVSASDGLNEPMTFTCPGLPTGATCGPSESVYTSGAGAPGLILNFTQLTANDYPFQIVGTADIVSHSVNALLRVGDFTATLDKTTATLATGQSATFNVTLASVNHYSNSITLLCEPAANTVSCSASPVPGTLTDGGTAQVQITVKRASAKAATDHKVFEKSSTVFLLGLVMPFSLMFVRWRASSKLFLLAMALSLLGTISCGGGGSTSGAGGGSGGGGNPQTVNVSVVAQIASTASDNSNQKNLGPIVITLQ